VRLVLVATALLACGQRAPKKTTGPDPNAGITETDAERRAGLRDELQDEILGVRERHREEDALVEGQALVHARLEPRDGQALGRGVLRERERRAPEHVARELVEQDDEREPVARGLGPRVELAAPRVLEGGAESGRDLTIDLGPAVEPFHRAAFERRHAVDGVALVAEPVAQNGLGVVHGPSVYTGTRRARW